MVFGSLRSGAAFCLLLLLQQSLTSLIKCDTNEADTSVNRHVRAVPATVPKNGCLGIEFDQFVQNTDQALTFTFLNMNTSVPLNHIDIRFKVVNEGKIREFTRVKGIQLGRLHADRQYKKEFLNAILKESMMGEYVNKRMKQAQVTTGEGESGAAQTFQYMTERLRPGQTVIYNMTYSDSIECETGPYEFKAPGSLADHEKLRVARIKAWLRRAEAPKLTCPGIQYEQSVRKTPYGLLFEFKNFNDTIELHYVDVHYRIQPAEAVATTQHRVRSDTPLGTQVNKRMSEVKNKFKLRGGKETELERRGEASQVYQQLIGHLEPGQILHYNMTYSNAVECDIGEFTYQESGNQFYRPHIRLRRLHHLSTEAEKMVEDGGEITMQTMKDAHLFDPLSKEALDFSTAAVSSDTRSVYMAEMSVDNEAEAESDNDVSVFHIAQEFAFNFSTACPLIHFEQRVILANETYTDSTGTVIEFINQDANTTQLAFILLVFKASSKTDMGSLFFRGRQVFLTSAHPLFRRMIETADKTAKAEAVVPQSNFTFILPQFPDNTTIDYYFIYGADKDRCKTETFTTQTTSSPTSMSRLMGRGRVLGRGDSLMWRMSEEARQLERTDESATDRSARRAFQLLDSSFM